MPFCTAVALLIVLRGLPLLPLERESCRYWRYSLSLKKKEWNRVGKKKVWYYSLGINVSVVSTTTCRQRQSCSTTHKNSEEFWRLWWCLVSVQLCLSTSERSLIAWQRQPSLAKPRHVTDGKKSNWRNLAFQCHGRLELTPLRMEFSIIQNSVCNGVGIPIF